MLDTGRTVALWRSNGDNGSSLQASFRDPGENWSTPVSLGVADKLYSFTAATNGVEVVVAAGFGTTFSNVDIDLVAFELAGGSDTWSAGTEIQSLIGVGASFLAPLQAVVGDDGIVTVATSTDPAGSRPSGASLIQRIDGVWGAPVSVVTPTAARGLHQPADDGVALGMSHVGGVSRVTAAVPTIDRGADESYNSPDDVFELLAVTATGDGGWSAPEVVHSTTGALAEFGDIYRNIAVGASDGDAVVVWTDSDVTEEGATPGVSARVKLASGALSSEQVLSTFAQTSTDVLAAGVAAGSTNDVGVLWNGLFDNTVRLRVWDATTDTWDAEALVNPPGIGGGEGFTVPTDLVTGPTGEMVVVMRSSDRWLTHDRSAVGVLAGNIIPLADPSVTSGMTSSDDPSIAIGGVDGVQRIAVIGSSFGSAAGGMFVIDDDQVAPVITSASVSVVSGGLVAATATATDNLGIRSIRFAWGDSTPDTVGTSTSAQHTYAASGTYTVTITVTDTASNVTSTTRSVTVSVVTAPGAPRALRATPRNASVGLSWTAPVSTGGAAVTDYVVQFRRTGTSSWTTFADGVRSTRSAVVTGLVNGRSYQFRVAAKNSVGTGAFSTAVSTTPRTVPGAPRSVAVTAARGALVLSWKAPSSNGGSAITDYQVQRRSAGAKKWTTVKDGVSTSTSLRFPDLTPGSRQQFRVRAVSVVGPGAWSEVVEGRVPR